MEEYPHRESQNIVDQLVVFCLLQGRPHPNRTSISREILLLPKWCARTCQIERYNKNTTFLTCISLVWLRWPSLLVIFHLTGCIMLLAIGIGHCRPGCTFVSLPNVFHCANTGCSCRPPHPPRRGRLMMHWCFTALWHFTCREICNSVLAVCQMFVALCTYPLYNHSNPYWSS